MTLLRDETPRLPSHPINPTAALRGSHFLLCCACCPVQSAWR